MSLSHQLLIGGLLLLVGGDRGCAAIVHAVDSPLDEVDLDPLDGVCLTASGTCTLRAAIMEANRTALPVPVEIVLPAGTYSIAIPPSALNGDESGDFNFASPASGTRNVVVRGSGAEVTIVDAGLADRVFRVDDAVAVAFHDITIRNGVAFAAAGNSGGGGIRIRGAVELHRVRIDFCSAAYGGAIWVVAGGSSELTAYDSWIHDNTAGEGGGLYLEELAHLERTTVSGNWATNGGGLFVDSNGELRLVDATVSANHAYDVGGGLALDGSGVANVYSSTIAFNRADADQDEFGDAGGVAVLPPSLFNVRNSLIVGNYVFDPQTNPDDCIGTVNSYGRNLFSDVAGCAVVTGTGTWQLLNDIALLLPLAPNGGATPTHALLTGANAIDGGDPELGCLGPVATIATDQRGAPRVQGERCDVGAYERGVWIFLDGFESGGGWGWTP